MPQGHSADSCPTCLPVSEVFYFFFKAAFLPTIPMCPAPQHHSYCIPTGSSTRLRGPGRPGDRPDQGKRGGKISLEYLGLLHLLCQQVPVSPAALSHGLTFLLSFLFLLVYLQKLFLLPFVSLTSSSFCLPLAFLTPPLHTGILALSSSLVAQPCFHLLGSAFCVGKSLFWSLLLILLPCLLLLHIRRGCSCAPRQVCWKVALLPWAL